jgi:glycosyltransferase involved in cell wall biosynthesis
VPLLSVVVPVYQNALHLPDLLTRLSAACGSVPGMQTELVFVDDRSRDDSFAVLRRLVAGEPRMRVVRLSRNFGSNAAILAGLHHAQGDVVVVITADLQDPPELIPEMIARWKDGHEVVLASRRNREDPAATRLFAGVFNRLFRTFVFRDFPADGFDFVALDRKVVARLVAMPEKNSYLFGQILWLGFTRAVIPYDRAPRAGGTSAWTFWRKVKYFIDAFTAFSYLPVRFASVAGFLLAILGFFYAAFVVLMRVTGHIPERGFSALMVVVLVASGTQLLVTGIMGEYLWRVLEEVRPRPAFVVDETLNLQPSRADGPPAAGGA